MFAIPAKARWIVVVFALTGCNRGDNITPGSSPDASVPIDAAVAVDAAEPDAPPVDAGNPLRPTRLEETGLYADFDNKILSADVIEYVPQFELWSDSATKRRWVQLPAGTVIDSSDMNFWVYPEGTKLWKEFARGGLLVETRLYWKQGPGRGDWRPFTFVWNAEQDDAVLETNGVRDALGTGHDVPTVFDCANCHSPQPDIVLGYSAVQLDGETGDHNLSDLVADSLLTDNPAGAGPTFFPLPGSAIEQEAFGILHGNCGGCHFPGSPTTDIVPLQLRLDPANMATVEDTATFMTTVGVAPSLSVPGTTSIVEPGDPASSALRRRMSSTANIRMPPVASEEVDTAAVTAIDAWINVVTAP